MKVFNFFLFFLMLGSSISLFGLSEFDAEEKLMLPENAPRGIVLREKDGIVDVFHVLDNKNIPVNDKEASIIIEKIENSKAQISFDVASIKDNNEFRISEFDNEIADEAWWFVRYRGHYYGRYRYGNHRRGCSQNNWYCGQYQYNYRPIRPYRPTYVYNYNFYYNFYRPVSGFRYYFYWY